MIRRCAEEGCGYLVRRQTRCPPHRPPMTQRGRRDEGSAGRAAQDALHATRLPSRADLEAGDGSGPGRGSGL